MDLKLRKAEAADWPLVQELELASDHPFFEICDGEEGTKRYLSESQVFLISLNNEAIGTISFKDTEENTVIINGLTVRPEHRGKGIAKHAMQELLQKIGNKKTTLYVHPKNIPALMLYLKLGFEITAWVDNPFGNGQPRLFLERQE